MADKYATRSFSVPEKGRFRNFAKGDEVPADLIDPCNLKGKGLVGSKAKKKAAADEGADA